MPKEQRQSSKLLGFKSFDTYKNVIALMIVMLDRSNIDMEVSDAGMESNDCREVSRDNRNVNRCVRQQYKKEQDFLTR